MEPQIYLFFKGRCEEAMGFYADLFGGETVHVMKNGDAAPEDRMPGGDDLVMHMAVKFGSTLIMASDNSDEMYESPRGFFVSMPAASADDARRWFDALAKDGEIVMPLGETFWSELFGMVRDRFGTPWMIGFDGAKAAG